MKGYVILLAFLSPLLMASSALHGQEEFVAIKAGEILTISGAPVTEGIILIKNGKIADIGTEITIPEGSPVIEASKGVVMPGLVDASAVQAVRGDLNEQSSEITPALQISNGLNPQSKVLKQMVQTGLTTLYISPGLQNLIGGLGVVVKPAGKTAAEMIIKDDAALEIVMGSNSTRGNRAPRGTPPINFYYRRPTTRMAVAWMLRKSFFDAKQYATSHEKENPEMEILSAALKGEIAIRVTARRALDIRTAFRIADEYGLRLILDECTEGYKVAEEIAQKHTPVVLGPFYYYPRSYNQISEGRKVNWNNAGILAKAGVKVALASGAQSNSIDLLTAATFAVRHGMPREQALKAITLTPAEILGVADRVGSLEKGKDADILILSGSPLAATSRIERVILNGEKVMKSTSHKAFISISLIVLALSGLVHAGPVRKKVAVQAGKIIKVAGADIQDGTILIEDGIIKAVGTDIEIPWDASVIEAKDKVVMPGFMLAHTSNGLDRENENLPEVPFLSTIDSIDPLAPYFEDSLRDGVVAMLVLPGNNTLLGGTGTVVRPHGRTVEAMLIKPYTGLKISLRPTRNTSRMGHMQRFRRYMENLKDYLEEYEQRKIDTEDEKKTFDEEIDPRKQSMLDLMNKRLTAFIYCERAADVPKAIEIQKTHKLNTVLVLSPDCYKAVDLIARSKLPVILDPQLIVWETNEETNEEEMKIVPMIFHKAGVKFAFQTDTSQYGRRYLWHQAATAIKHGMKRTEALKSITLYPAQFIGVDDRLGSVEAGKEATLIFLTGDPFDAQTWVDQVMIAGEIVYERAKDERLKKLLEKPEEIQTPEYTD
ncbi:MAG: amidohydrolase family protein [Planctomycetota bacterium]